jgi:Restriction endonuclease
MSETMHAYLRFEDLVGELLKANGFEVSPLPPEKDQGYDFLAKLGNVSWAVEVKYYRTARAQLSLVETAAARLSNIIVRNNKMKGMLIVSCSLSPEHRLALENKFGLVFVDRSDLFIWTAKTPDLADELRTLLEERQLSGELPKGRDIKESLAVAVPPIQTTPIDSKGTDLCNELRSLKRGKISWSDYEKLCDKILKYLFPNDLHGWHTQKRTDDGLNRFDYVCRIKPSTEFWTFLLDHLNSRYVLFEFKNYRGLIKQGQILTTEKYLLEKGLRRVAIILSRGGAEKNAIAMTQGAMRESGKLMLVLDDDKVCQMLHMKEQGEDPTDLLFEVADDFMLSLPR